MIQGLRVIVIGKKSLSSFAKQLPVRINARPNADLLSQPCPVYHFLLTRVRLRYHFLGLLLMLMLVILRQILTWRRITSRNCGRRWYTIAMVFVIATTKQIRFSFHVAFR